MLAEVSLIVIVAITVFNLIVLVWFHKRLVTLLIRVDDAHKNVSKVFALTKILRSNISEIEDHVGSLFDSLVKPIEAGDGIEKSGVEVSFDDKNQNPLKSSMEN